jgi:hypothetical protein
VRLPNTGIVLRSDMDIDTSPILILLLIFFYLAMPGAQPADHIACIVFLLRDAYADEYRKRDVK